MLVTINGTTRIDSGLANVTRQSRAFEVAHIRDKEHYERIKRAFSLTVVVLTAVNGTAVVAALTTGDTSETWAKVTVGVLTILSAVAAALNDKGPFGEQVDAHGKAASSFTKLYRKGVKTARDWSTGQIDQEETEKLLNELETNYDDLKNSSPDVRNYKSAHEFAEQEEKEHGY